MSACFGDLPLVPILHSPRPTGSASFAVPLDGSFPFPSYSHILKLSPANTETSSCYKFESMINAQKWNNACLSKVYLKDTVNTLKLIQT